MQTDGWSPLNKRNPLLVRGLVIFSILAALYLIPFGKSEKFPTLCLHRLLTGRACWGCGTLRALHDVLHLDFLSAWSCNPLIFVIIPLLAYSAIRWLLQR